jgi:hypothetical protein
LRTLPPARSRSKLRGPPASTVAPQAGVVRRLPPRSQAAVRPRSPVPRQIYRRRRARHDASGAPLLPLPKSRVQGQLVFPVVELGAGVRFIGADSFLTTRCEDLAALAGRLAAPTWSWAPCHRSAAGNRRRVPEARPHSPADRGSRRRQVTARRLTGQPRPFLASLLLHVLRAAIGTRPTIGAAT